jgi:hypothetical protein
MVSLSSRSNSASASARVGRGAQRCPHGTHCFAELARACDDAARKAVLDELSSIQTSTLVQTIKDRRKISRG